ncbi:MAG: tRNA (adenosine(37)-N6)-threonylcarbamoyltransferase complex dimerization subunit type 1 TsaB [Lachnospiraceae bacterium]|nr:tRNA (adenosine(37)-N6)-threonylcarbamoyltransferase complex dimerization subunit type 1 TsaB [Lachnospiraceae bacterium]
MKMIGIDSSGLVASVAIMEENKLVAEYTINNKKTHSQTLLPMLEEVVSSTGLDMKEIDAIAIAAGPGSFTGLRIGSATAKGLGLALQKPIVPVSTVEALAYNLYGTAGVVCPIMDARRNQVYTGVYEFGQADDNDCMHKTYRLNVLKEACAVPIGEITQVLNEIGREVVFLGDGVPVFAEQLKTLMNVPYSFAPAHLALQRAGCVASLGMEKFRAGIFEDAASHSPEYLRLSQAERERKEAGLL